SRTWRAAAQPARRVRIVPRSAGASAVTAFDEDTHDVRVRVASTASYQLVYTLLSQKGFPAGVPIAQVSVHRHEFVPNQNPPYVTVELPIEVDDTNRNGVFDNIDRIYVYARTWAERAGASAPQRRWGDSDYLFVTFLNGASGLRMSQRGSWLGTSPPLLASYPYRQHLEQNSEFFRTPDDTILDPFHWTNGLPYYDRISFPTGEPPTHFPLNQLDPSHAVSFTVRVLGRSYNNHVFAAQVVNGAGVVTAIGDS